MQRFALSVCTALCAVCAPSLTRAQTATELPHPFVYLSVIDSSIQQEMRYWSSDNFVGRPVDGYEAPECILTSDTALALKRVQALVDQRGYSLRVYDCYRPVSGVADFARWSQNSADTKMKQKYYPDLDKRELFRLGYIATRSRHSRGNAVDLTLVEKGASARQLRRDDVPTDVLRRCDESFSKRAAENTLDFGTGYDCLNPKSQTLSQQVSEDAQRHRRILLGVMSEVGFENYSKEWWHFELKGAGTSSAFDFKVQKRRVATVAHSAEDPARALPSLDCPVAVDQTGLFQVDCTGKSVDIVVLSDPAGAQSLGTIFDYDSHAVWSCKCSKQDSSAIEVDWCEIQYKKSKAQIFESGWVLYRALQNPKNGPKPICVRT
jgi:D-alanyl-D-alanine dipeptidase